MRWFGTAAVALAAMGWGTWSLFLRGSGLTPAWQSILILCVIATIGAAPALAGAGRPHSRPRPPRLWLLIAALGFFDAGGYLLFFGAVDRGPISVAVLTHYLAPVVVAGCAPAFLREPLGPRTLPALAASLVGLGLLLGSGGATGFGAVWPTAALGAASALFYGGATLVGKKALRDFSNQEALAWHCAVSALLLLPLAGAPPPLAAFLGRPLAGAALLGAGGGWLFYFGLARVPAQRAAVLTYLEPLVASVVGALAFGERHSAAGLLGAALILGAGAAVALQADPQR